MTAAELITKLSTFPGDAEVFVPFGDAHEPLVINEIALDSEGDVLLGILPFDDEESEADGLDQDDDEEEDDEG